MLQFQSILCPVDFSEFSSLSLKYAAAIAKDCGGRLVVCHVIPDYQTLGYAERIPVYNPRFAEDIRSQLDLFVAQTISSEYRAIKRVEMGSPTSTIFRFVEEEDANLIVLGTHGRSGLDRLLLGSVTYKILNKSKIPVLTVCKPVRNFLPEDPEKSLQIKRILCAVEPEQKGISVLQTALSFARTYQSKIFFVHVHPSEAKEEYIQQLREIIKPEQEDWCEMSLVSRTGDSVSEILSVEKEYDIDLLIMGHRERGAINFGMLGSAAAKLTAQSNCPVLVVREE